MSNTDFDPDAYLSTPVAPPAAPVVPPTTPVAKSDTTTFDPNTYLAQPASTGFDPDAYLKQPSTPPQTGEGNALTDIIPEEKRAASETWQSIMQGLGPESNEQTAKETAAAPFWDITPQLRSVMRAGSAIGSALSYPFQATVAAPARSLIGHPLAAAEEAIGTNVDPQKLKAALDAGVPKDQAIVQATENPQQTYERWRGNVDTALSAIRPKGVPEISPQTIDWSTPSKPAPAAPVQGPFGVTLSQGEEANDLAARVREQSFLREGSKHAQAFGEQRVGQLAEAPQTAAATLDAGNQVIASSPQTAADIVGSALEQHQSSIDALIKNSEQNLGGMNESIRAGLSPTNAVLAEDPMEAANIIQGSVANEEQRAAAAKNQAYQALDESDTVFHPAAFNNAATFIRSFVDKADKININPDTTPIANRALNELEPMLESIVQQRDPDTGRLLANDPITPSVLDDVRKRLNVYVGDAKASAIAGKPSDARAMRSIVDGFDALIEDRIVKGTVTQGNPLDALSQMRLARGLNTAYRQKFFPRGPGDRVGLAIQNILGRYEGSAATPEQVQSILYNPTNPTSVQVAGRLKDMFGEASPEFGAAKQGLYSFMTERPPGKEAWGPGQVADRIDQFTKGPGRSLTQAYLNPDEITRIQELGQRLRSHAKGVELAENPFEGVDFNAVFRRAVNQDPKAVGLLDEALNRLGATSPQASALRQGLFLRAVQPLEGVVKGGPKTIGDNLTSLLASTRNSSVYSPAQRDMIKAYIDLMRKIETPRGIYAPSEPAIRRAMSVVGYRAGQIIGAIIGRSLTPGVPLIGEFAGITIGGRLEKAAEAATLGRVKKQLPLVTEQMDKYQKAYSAWQRNQNAGTSKLMGVAAANLAGGLQPLGIDFSKLPLSLPGTAPAQDQQQRAAGGGVQDSDDNQPLPFLSQQDLADPDIVPAHDGQPLRLTIHPSNSNPMPPADAPQTPVEAGNAPSLAATPDQAGEGLEAGLKPEETPTPKYPLALRSGIGLIEGASDELRTPTAQNRYRASLTSGAGSVAPELQEDFDQKPMPSAELDSRSAWDVADNPFPAKNLTSSHLDVDIPAGQDWQEGFVNNKGHFLSRRKAFEYAMYNNLIPKEELPYYKKDSELASEMLGSKNWDTIANLKRNSKQPNKLTTRTSGGKVVTDAYDNYIPRPVSHQQHYSQPKHLPERAAGGRVNPANINREPSDAQKKSGAYAKDHVNLHGLAITIENAKGSTRSGVGKDGKPWSSILPSHYGYLRKQANGKDGDKLDVYLGPHTKASHVFIIDQLDKDTKKFDEHKIFLSFGSKNQAAATYKRAFSDGKGAARIGAVHSMTMNQFKSWLQEGDTKAPYKEPERKKLPHKTVGYVEHSERPNRHCGVCTMFISAEHNGPACTLVASPIDPGGWCRHFRRRKF